ncbi:MAG TPA: HemK2/MTQ2 family protein methyltransferase [Candidatus Kapabacteria bacterium]|nr:HemK2/MTQ2 family protein methyltransferase [Candidatus Kapabacteria bacterium]
MKKFLRRLLSAVIYNTRIRKTLRREVRIGIGNIDLTISPTVFNPAFFTTSKFLAEYISSLDLKNKKVLDAGTGSGILAIAAAQQGALVTAIDMNSTAVECTEANARNNNVSINVLQSDWFDALGEEKFDVIVSNPPFVKGEVMPPYGIAWYSGAQHELVIPLIDSSVNHLTTGGYALFIISSDADVEWFTMRLGSVFSSVQIVAREKSYFEEFFIIKASQK